MAGSTVVINLWHGMVGTIGLFVSYAVAGITILSSTGKTSPGMAGCAIRRLMSASQWKTREAVIVSCVVPFGGDMTSGAIAAESRLYVRRIASRIEFFHVAELTFLASPVKTSGRVTTGAISVPVCAS